MAYRYDLKVEQGATFVVEIECQDEAGNPIDLTGYSAAAQIRRTHSSASPSAEFTPTIIPTLGRVSLALTASQTSGVTHSTGVWDCELTSPEGVVTRLAEGKVSVSPEVTK